MKLQKDQLPAGAQISTGNTKNPVGVIEEGFVADGDVLKHQAAQLKRYAPDAQIYQSGAEFGSDVIERVQPMYDGVSVSEETIAALQQGDTQRAQEFTGNNANWTGYYLEQAAKLVFPVNTPLKNMLPRVPGVGIDTINWRAITDVFGGSGPTVAAFALQQNASPTALSYNWVNASNVYKMLSVQDTITFEAEIYSRLFEPGVRAKIAANLIPALMLGQEVWYTNGSQRLWAPPPAQAVASTSAGSVSAGTYWFLITAVNANGETLAASATATSAVLSGTGQITLTIFRVPGATSYRVYCGSGSSQPANSAMWRQSASSQFGASTALDEPASSIVSQGYFTATMTANPAGSGTAYSTIVTAGNTAITVKSTDTSTNNLPLVFDGIQSLIYLNSGTGSAVGVGGETPLVRQPAATNGSLALSDADNLLEAMYLNARANPDVLFVSVKDHKKLSYLVAQGTNFRVTTPNGPGLADLMAGQRATKYINQTTGKVMDIVMLPYLPQGTIIAASFSIPFNVSEITKPPLRIEYNREMWAMEYPPTQASMTKYAYAAFSNETMCAQYLGGLGILNGITLN